MSIELYALSRCLLILGHSCNGALLLTVGNITGPGHFTGPSKSRMLLSVTSSLRMHGSSRYYLALPVSSM